MASKRLGPGYPPQWSLPLCALLLFEGFTGPLQAQKESASSLRVIVLEGDGAINSIEQRSGRDLAVRIEDEEKRPVSGAMVTFQLPQWGPSGRFSDDSTTAIVVTDAQGHARVSGMRPNSLQGEFQIRVTASYQGSSAGAAIIQTNVMAVGSPGAGVTNKKWLTLLGVAGGAGVALALLLARQGNIAPDQPEDAVIIITPGTANVSDPR